MKRYLKTVNDPALFINWYTEEYDIIHVGMFEFIRNVSRLSMMAESITSDWIISYQIRNDYGIVGWYCIMKVNK